jgi:hypothetical protein
MARPVLIKPQGYRVGEKWATEVHRWWLALATVNVEIDRVEGLRALNALLPGRHREHPNGVKARRQTVKI